MAELVEDTIVGQAFAVGNKKACELDMHPLVAIGRIDDRLHSYDIKIKILGQSDDRRFISDLDLLSLLKLVEAEIRMCGLDPIVCASGCTEAEALVISMDIDDFLSEPE